MQVLIEAASHAPQWNWYVIADSAQHRDLPSVLARADSQARCLLNAPPDSPLAANSPHLVQMEKPAEDATTWKWIERNASRKPCATVLASEADFDTLFSHLQQFTEVRLPDGEEMFFAFWDPAVLGVLVGQLDDPTLYVPGPVLNDVQHATFTQHITGWWYWDRNGTLRSIQLPDPKTERASIPLQLNQRQVDELVEASVPDHVLYHIELNQPQLLSNTEPAQRYGLVCMHLQNARSIQLETMYDLVNYVCAALICKEQFQTNPDMVASLERVRNGELTLTQALQHMP